MYLNILNISNSLKTFTSKFREELHELIINSIQNTCHYSNNLLLNTLTTLLLTHSSLTYFLNSFRTYLLYSVTNSALHLFTYLSTQPSLFFQHAAYSISINILYSNLTTDFLYSNAYLLQILTPYLANHILWIH